MAAEKTVIISALEAALRPKVIQTTGADALSTTFVKIKVPGSSGTVEVTARTLVDDKKVSIEEELDCRNLFFPKEFYPKVVGQGFGLDEAERKSVAAELALIDIHDAKLFRSFQSSLKGAFHEKKIYDVTRSNQTRTKFSLIMNISFPHMEKLLKKGPAGGELDSLLIRADLNLRLIEIKSELLPEVLRKAQVQLERGEACIRAAVGSFPAEKATEVTLHPYIFFGNYKTRKDLKKVIDCIAPGLDEPSQKRLLCQEDLEDMDKLLPSVGTIYKPEYEQLVSIFYCAHLMSPTDTTGSLVSWSEALVGKVGTTAGITQKPTPADHNKFKTIQHQPLSSDHAMLFWTPQQIALIHDLNNLCVFFCGPFGSGKTQILRAIRERLKGDPSIKVFMISALGWYYGRIITDWQIFILDILTNSTTAVDIKRELNTSHSEFWVLLPKYIQHKLDTESGSLAFLIDEVPLPPKEEEQISWRENWRTVSGNNRALIRMACRPDHFGHAKRMKSRGYLDGFSFVLLDKVLRNTSSVCKVAEALADSGCNFPLNDTKKSSVVGDLPILYIVEESEDMISKGIPAAYLDNAADLEGGVILCQTSSQVHQIKTSLQGIATFTVFTGEKETGELAYAHLKTFFQRPKGVLITTAECFCGMDSSCVLATEFYLTTRLFNGSKITSSHISYRPVAKFIMVVSRADARNMEVTKILGKWDLRNGLDCSRIETLAQFDTFVCKLKIQSQDSTIKDKELRIEELEGEREDSNNSESRQRLNHEKEILHGMQEVRQQLEKINQLYQLQMSGGTNEEIELEIEQERSILQEMQIHFHKGDRDGRISV